MTFNCFHFQVFYFICPSTQWRRQRGGGGGLSLMTLVACADFMLLLQRATCRIALPARALCLHLPFPYLIAHLDKARLTCCLPPSPFTLTPPSTLAASSSPSLSLCYSLACHCLLPLLTSIFIAFHDFNVACRNFLRCFCSLLFVSVVVVVVSCHLCNSLLNSRLQRGRWRRAW